MANMNSYKKYTTLEVIRMLTNTGNSVFKLLNDNKKFIVDTEKETVTCMRINMIFKDKVLSVQSFSEVIREAGGQP